MADSALESAHRALRSLSNIAEECGYLKKEIKEDIQNLLRVLKNVFTGIRADINSMNEEKRRIVRCILTY